VFKKHGGDFMWSEAREKQLASELEKEKITYALEQSSQMDESRVADVKKVKKKIIKDKIIAITAIQRVDKNVLEIYSLVLKTII
jgi:hypothetical protein